MEGAAAGFLILAIWNYAAASAKYFIWGYYVLDLKTLIPEFMGADTSALSLDASSITTQSEAEAAAKSALGLMSLIALAGKAVGKLNLLPFGALVIGSLMNSGLTFWPMIYYRPSYALDPARIGAYFSACQSFFTVWWIFGWASAAMMFADLFVAMPNVGSGNGVGMNWSFYLSAYCAGEWLITSVVMAAIFPALEAWFIKNRVI